MLSEENTSPSAPVAAPSLKIGISLRRKATLAAVAIGTIPVLAVGLLAYLINSNQLQQLILQEQRDKARSAMERVQRFTFERYGDIQVLANLMITLRSRNVPPAQQAAILEEYRKTYQIYDSIAVTDAEGNTTLAVGAEAPKDFKQIDYYLQVVATRRPVFNQPRKSVVTNRYSLFFAAPIIEKGQLVGMIRTRVPMNFVDDLVKEFGANDSEYRFSDKNGVIFTSNEADIIGKPLVEDIPVADRLRQEKQAVSLQVQDSDLGVPVLAGYSPWQPILGLPDVEWGVVVSTPESVAFAPVAQLGRVVLFGTLVSAIAVATIAIIVAERFVRPIQESAKAVQQIGQGELATRVAVVGNDELAVLGSNINSMAGQLQVLVAEQQQEAERLEQARQEARAEADQRAMEQQTQREQLQRRALELLMQVDPVSRGDLTVSAKVTEDEIGTLADSYNSLVRSLRQIVGNVQTAAQAVNSTAGQQEIAVSTVADNASRQVEAVGEALAQIQAIAESLQGVAERAKQAEMEVQETTKVVQAGDNAMERTVESISAIRETVSETAKKVKRLGEASQKISKVVNLISDFADQTNLLALNAAIEAARAGEEGRGFAVVAEEVRILAQQSATATAEIEELVQEIQVQTNQVVSAMEEGTDQVVIGSQLVEESRDKLSQIAQASGQVNRLVREIAQSASDQTKTSEVVSKTMLAVANTVKDTSSESRQVAQSFKELLAVAQELQVTVSQFKL
jgi:twitching motility protein PilJ